MSDTRQVLAPGSAGIQIRKRREAAGLTRAQLAQRAGIARQTIYSYESDGRTPTPAVADHLADVLGCNASDLRGRGDA